jgi:hypothetical protein
MSRLKRMVTLGTPLALLRYVTATGDETISKERSTPMKVKTNMKAGNALWGS